MTTLTVTAAAVCSGGNHITVTVTGDVVASKVFDKSELTAALTAEDMLGYARVKFRMAKNGRTAAAALTLMQAGVTETI